MATIEERLAQRKPIYTAPPRVRKIAARDAIEPDRDRKVKAEGRLARAIRRHLQAQRARMSMVVQNVGAFKAMPPGVAEQIEAALLNTRDIDAAIAEVARILEDVARGAVDSFGDDIGLDADWTLTNDKAAKWARKQAGLLIADINATTLKLVRSSVGAFVDTPGMTLGDVVKRLQGAFDVRRALRIAVTEVTRTYAEANQIAADDLAREWPGVRVIKEWHTNNDDRVCPICGPLHGERVANDESFGEFDNPPAHPNCRCWVTYRTVADD